MKREKIRFRLKYKIAMLVALVSLLSVGIIAIFAFITAKEHIHEMVDVQYMGQTKLTMKDIKRFLDEAELDLHFLMKTPPVQGIMRARDNNGYDPIGKSSYRQWTERLQIILKQFMQTHTYYMQIRLIDEAGLELVRVDYDGKGVRLVPEQELQNKSSRYYFKETMKLGPGEVYTSGIDLNREQGKIEVPYKPTLRYASPVFDAKGDRKGIFILNVFAEKFLEVKPISETEGIGHLFVADQDGFYLHHSRQPAKEWGGKSDLDTGENLFKDYPDLSSKILSEQEGEIYSGEDEVFYSLLKVSDRLSFILGIAVPIKIVNAPLYQFRNFFIGIIVGVLGLTLIVSVIFSKWILAPVEKLKEATAKISEGNFDSQIEITSNDEIRELSDDFKNMAQILKKKTERLTNLYELGISIGKAPVEIADIIVSTIVSVMKVRMAAVEKVKDDTISIVSLRDGASLIHEGVFSLKGTPCGEVSAEKKMCQYHQAAEQFPNDTFLQEKRVVSYLGVPVLSSQGELLGVINAMDGRRIEFSKEDEELLYTLSRRMAFEWEQEANIAELEQRVEERTQEIQAVNKELVRANQAKSDFLASMSHELRTPLNAIIGFSEVLQDQYFGKLNEKQAEYLKDILESGRHLLSLISDILDLSKVEAGKAGLELVPVNIKALLENSLTMIKEKAAKHGIGLDIQVPEELADFEIQADERKLKQVMFNLLSNAVKFTPDGGNITVEAGKEQEELTLSVADTGIGIALNDQKKLFEEFYQVKGGKTGKTPGTGLGLALSRRFVELHGGRIRMESKGEGKGSRFSFTLPLK